MSVYAEIYRLREFEEYDSAYMGFSTKTIDNKLYFSLCTHNQNYSAGVFSFDITTKNVNKLCDISELLNQGGNINSLTHGKIHTKLFTDEENTLFFGTHFSYPNCNPQDIFYEGGHIIALNPLSGHVDDHGVLIKGEGIVTMEVDLSIRRCYILTSPSNYFIDYDLVTRQIRYLNKIDITGSSICRNLGIDQNGDVYGCSESFKIFKYSHNEHSLNYLTTNFNEISSKNEEWVSSKKKGSNKVGRTMWRCIEFDSSNNVFYGINASDSSLFLFDHSQQSTEKIENLENLSGKDIYPTLTFVKRGSEYYYVPANGKFDFQLSEGIKSTCTLVKFDAETNILKSYGLIFGQNNETIFGAGAAMCTNDGILYLLGSVTTNGSESCSNSLYFSDTPYDLALIEVNLNSL
ncbi:MULTISPECIES: hypothetical protein [Paenibacillus]|uniref:Uncharacterized protein n=1 Tax=Paenibacillus borealis TaxID=160799 RepID=A0ABX3GW48_PAEBO|nr:hypothetical protein [Paenibacillus borealis]OMD36387.1 hypothetical protein BSK56_32210 [Paenibacillus borealis]